jgi:negative regulator of sigma E activity
MNEMLESQLSAMFDDELPAAECELLARRLSRDEALQARWRRYAVMAAVVRGEKGLALNIDIASRVGHAIAAEPVLSGAHVVVPGSGSRVARRIWQGVAGAAVAAGVAALSIFWLRSQPQFGSEALVAQTSPPAGVVVASGENDAETYVVPATVESRAVVPTAELANYVVAHSEYSAPLTRRNILSSLVASEAPTAEVSETHVQDAQ